MSSLDYLWNCFLLSLDMFHLLLTFCGNWTHTWKVTRFGKKSGKLFYFENVTLSVEALSVSRWKQWCLNFLEINQCLIFILPLVCVEQLFLYLNGNAAISMGKWPAESFRTNKRWWGNIMLQRQLFMFCPKQKIIKCT